MTDGKALKPPLPEALRVELTYLTKVHVDMGSATVDLKTVCFLLGLILVVCSVEP